MARCLAKHADERFQTAAELAAALEARRDLPVPLRVFLGRLSLSLYSGAGLSLLGVLALLQLIGELVLGEWGMAALAGGFIALLLGATALFLATVTPGERSNEKAAESI